MLNDYMRFATQERRIGHESITTTANTYGHLYKGKTDDADAIDQLLWQRANDDNPDLHHAVQYTQRATPPTGEIARPNLVRAVRIERTTSGLEGSIPRLPL